MTMENKQEVLIQEDEPVSPTGQYFSSSVLSVSILFVLESEITYNNELTMALLKNVFLPINPRFSSIMVMDDHGLKQWKKVHVKLEDHIKLPAFPSGLSPESYDKHFQYYMSKIGKEQHPLSRPLWEIHIFKYPTSNAAETLIFKLHHALGDGFSLMGALFSCFERAHDPSLPLTFPSLLRLESNSKYKRRSTWKRVPKFLSMFANTTADFISTFLKSNVDVDDRTPIRSGLNGVEFEPVTVSTVTFSLDHIKQIKAKLGGTVNDIIMGVIFYGTRLYMESAETCSSNASSTVLMLLNTRAFTRYHTVNEMAKANTKSSWGNQFAFLPVSIPKVANAETANPLKFVLKAHKIIKQKKHSPGVYLTGRFLDLIRKVGGPETTARCIYKTMKNSSMAISNMIGPIEKIAIADHPCKGMYFMVMGAPQSLTITMVSYMGKLRVAVGAQKGFIYHQRFNSCLEKAFEKIFKASVT